MEALHAAFDNTLTLVLVETAAFVATLIALLGGAVLAGLALGIRETIDEARHTKGAR